MTTRLRGKLAFEQETFHRRASCHIDVNVTNYSRGPDRVAAEILHLSDFSSDYIYAFTVSIDFYTLRKHLKRQKFIIELGVLLERIGLLSNLQAVTAQDSEHTDARARIQPCPSLSIFLSNLSPSLSRMMCLRLEVELSVDPQEVTVVAEVLSLTAHLEELSITKISFPYVWPTDTINLDPLLTCLSRNLHLKKVHLGRIGLATLIPLLHDDAIRRIISSPSLEEICFEGMNLSDQEVIAISEGLVETKSVKRVALCGGYWNDLERLHSPKLSGAVGLQMATMMAANYSIEVLILSSISMESRGMASMTYWLTQVASYCKLNSLGRIDAFQNPNSLFGDWITLISEVSNDVNAVFSLLRERPSLCQRSSKIASLAVPSSNRECS